jgi:hypothetical protein
MGRSGISLPLSRGLASFLVKRAGVEEMLARLLKITWLRHTRNLLCSRDFPVKARLTRCFIDSSCSIADIRARDHYPAFAETFDCPLN